MRAYHFVTTSLFTALLYACGGTTSNQPIQVTDRTILEVEEFSASSGTALLEWMLVELDDDHGAAARLVARDGASWSEDGLPSLTYEIDFQTTGQYQLSLRGRQDSSHYTTQPVNMIFGADSGDVVWTVTGLDDQWTWYDIDTHGQQMRIDVATAGVHQLRIASDAEGLILDQLDVSRVTEAEPSPTPSNDEQNESTQQDGGDPTQETGDSGTDTQSTEIAEQAPDNQPPAAAITADNTVAAGTALGLAVDASDDGLPHGGIYYFWTKISGPGNADISALQAPVTSITFDQPGSYTVQATVSDGNLYSNATHDITVTAAPSTDSTGAGNDPDQSTGQHSNTGQDTNDETNQSSEQTTDQHSSTDNIPASLRWHLLTTKGKVRARHEAGGVVVNGKLYVIGGRGDRPVDVYDPRKNSWSRISNAPMEMHHFQPVAVGNKIYVVGAFTCCYPREDIVEHIHIFDTVSRKWSKGPKMPQNRKRGSAGAVVYNNKIYLLGGNTKGHSGGAVSWFDEFDPKTGRWKKLANAPDARDHVTIAVVNAKLVVAGGRKTARPVAFANTVGRTNVYDFRTGKWSTAASIPTQRAGTMTVAMGDEVIVLGGESTRSKNAHRNVEAFNVNTGRWRTLTQLKTARHGGAVGVLNGRIHVVAGNIVRGGGAETSDHEVLK